MPVAPSYQSYLLLSNKPYIIGSKYYVDICNPATKKVRVVRWYSDYEYAKSYGKTANKIEKYREPREDNMREARGFSQGPILVVRNVQPQDEAFLKKTGAKYTIGIGWHYPSTAILSDHRPPHFSYLLLGFKEFCDDDENIPKSPMRLAEILAKKSKKGEYINI